jgi:hypothetical protein
MFLLKFQKQDSIPFLGNIIPAHPPIYGVDGNADFLGQFLIGDWITVTPQPAQPVTVCVVLFHENKIQNYTSYCQVILDKN